MAEIVSYFMGSWALGWCFGFGILAFNKFAESTIT